MKVTETFFAVEVEDMERATRFYVDVFGATVSTALPFWSSLHVAGVRIGLALAPHAPRRIGLHFAVDEVSRLEIERAGGRVGEPVAVAPGVVIVDVTDTEGNTFIVSPRARH